MATIRVKNPNLGGEKWIAIPTKILSEADHIVTNKGQGNLYLSNDGTYKDVIKSANDYTDKLIELITGSSPDILETLKELSNQTSDNKDFINVLNKSIATKLDKTANAVSASKLATPIKLWGNDFDGSLSVYGNLCAPNGNLGLGINTNNVVLGNNTNPSYIYGSSVMFKTGTDAVAAYISYDGKVGIGTANPLNALDVIGTGYFYTHLYCPIVIESSKNTVGIKFISSDTSDGLYLLANDKNFYITDNGWTTAHKIWHEGNLNPFDLSGNTLKLGKSTNLNQSYAELVSVASESSDNGVALRYWKTRDYLGSYSGIQIDSRGIWYDKTGGTLYKIWNEDNDGHESGLDADTLDGHHSGYFAKSLSDVGANNVTYNALGYTYSTTEHGGYVAGGLIYAGMNGYGMLLNGSFGGGSLAYRGYDNGKFTDWKKIAFTNSDITGNAATATKAYALLSNAASANVDANKMVTANCYMLYISYMGNESTNVPVANAYLNGLVSFGLHPNGTTAQLYISKDNPLYYRSSVTNDWKELATSDGYYKDMRVGLADDLGSVEEKIEEEYIIQPTANTNEIRDGYAHIDSLKGNSIVWNLLIDTSLLRSTGEHNGITYTFSNNEIIANGTSSNISFGDSALGLIKIEAIEGHKYYVGYGGGSPNCYIQIYSSTSGHLVFSGPENNKECISTCPSTLKDWVVRIRISSGTTVTNLRFKYSLIDLTKMFGSGNEPETVEEFYARIPQGIDLYAYNEGEIVNLTADSIKSVGFNQWDEVVEKGGISWNTGLEYSDQTTLRTKYIPVCPNIKYWIKHPVFMDETAKSYWDICWYDINYNYIGGSSTRVLDDEIATLPYNAYYVRFKFCNHYGNVYNDDICINVHNTDKNGTYEPYKEFVRQLPTNLFEGGMKSIGTIYDEIYWDKNKKKYIKVNRIGSIDLGSLNWERTVKAYVSSEYKFISTIDISNINGVPESLHTCSNYLHGDVNEEGTDKVLDIGNKINIVDNRYTDANTFKQAMQGVILYYELKEPIIEELDIPYMDYEVSNDGTERIESSTPSTPIKASVTYNFDAVNTIKLNRFDISDIKKGATKLAKPVKLWGNDFDGSSSVTESIYLKNNSSLYIADNQNNPTSVLVYNNSNVLALGYSSSGKGHGTSIFGSPVTFYTGTDRTYRMIINSLGNIGIGTTNPQYKLDVAGNIHASDRIILENNKGIAAKDTLGRSCDLISLNAYDIFNIGYGVAGNGHKVALDGDYIYFRYGTSHTNGMILNSSGNITIGSSDAATDRYKLHVLGKVYLNEYGAMGNQPGPYLHINKSGNPFAIGTTSGHIDAISFGYASDNSWINETITISSTGNCVGINNNNPKYALDVNGVIYSNDGISIANSKYYQIKDVNGTSCGVLSISEANQLVFGYGTAARGYDTYLLGNSLLFKVNTTNLTSMVINPSGNVTIGSSDLASNNYKLYVDGNIYSSGKFLGKAVYDGNGNDIVSTYMDLGSRQTITGRKSFAGRVDVDGEETLIVYSSLKNLTVNKGHISRKTFNNGIMDWIGHFSTVTAETYYPINYLLNNATTGNTYIVNSFAADQYGPKYGGNMVIYSLDNSIPEVMESVGVYLCNVHTGNNEIIPVNNKVVALGTFSKNGAYSLMAGTYPGVEVAGGHFMIGSHESREKDATGALFSWHKDQRTLDINEIYYNTSENSANTRNITLTVNGKAIVEDDWYGVSWSEGSSDLTCTRIGNMALHRSLPILSAMKGYLISSEEVIIPVNSDWNALKYEEDVSVWILANVMVKIPEFWYIDDYEPSTKTHNLKISQTAKAGWLHHKEAYVGAYEGCDENDCYRSKKDVIPTVSKNRERLRTAARANGYEDEYKWNIYTYEEHRAICHLFLVEYATRNSQATVNTELTSDGFKQGGLGSGCTTGSVTINGQTTYSFIPTGTTDSLGNGSGQVAYTVTQTDTDGNEIGTVTRYANRYRGIENPFGHIWKHVDDIVNVYNAESGNKTVYKCNKPEHFATNKNAKYKPLCAFPGGSKMQGWSKEIKATINCDFFKYSVGGSESTYWCDYNYDNDDTSEHCLLIGGGSGDGSLAGLFYFSLGDGVGSSTVTFGSRLTYLPWAE